MKEKRGEKKKEKTLHFAEWSALEQVVLLLYN